MKLKFGLIILLLTGLSKTILAQCAMCAATAESSVDAGSTAATGLNPGVLYLLVLPFLFALTFIILYFLRQRAVKQHEQAQTK